MSTTLQKCVAPKLGIINKYKQIINDNTDCMMTFTSLQTLQYFEFIVERFVHLLYAVLGSTMIYFPEHLSPEQIFPSQLFNWKSGRCAAIHIIIHISYDVVQCNYCLSYYFSCRHAARFLNLKSVRHNLQLLSCKSLF